MNTTATHRYDPPRAGLEDYVRTVLTIDAVMEDKSLPVIPQGTPAMVCTVASANGESNPAVRLLLFGRAVDAGTFFARCNVCVMAYFFRPFTVAALFGFPAGKLGDRPVDLEEQLPREAKPLCENIARVKTTPERLALIDGFLLALRSKNNDKCEIVRVATDRMMERPDVDVLSNIPRELEITERTLQRVFKKYVGVTPNQFKRFCRFHAAFEQVRNQAFARLSDVAYEQGYADQSHFTRAFREFMQLSPHEYVKSGLPRRLDY